MKQITERFSSVASATRSELSLAVRVALTIIKGYKLFISPHFRGSCRFLPSCADYAAEALRVHGVVGGTWLAIRRLARCHPLCTAGYDPVPGRRPAANAGQAS